MSLIMRYSSNTANGVQSCGGPVDTSDSGLVPANIPLNGLFDKVLKHENVTGSTEYRLVYIVNDTNNSDKVYNPKVLMISVPEVEVAIGALPKNEVGQALSSESETPSGVVFKTKSELNQSSGGELSFPDGEELAPGEFVGLWIKRKVEGASGSGTIREDLSLQINYRV